MAELHTAHFLQIKIEAGQARQGLRGPVEIFQTGRLKDLDNAEALDVGESSAEVSLSSTVNAVVAARRGGGGER